MLDAVTMVTLPSISSMRFASRPRLQLSALANEPSCRRVTLCPCFMTRCSGPAAEPQIRPPNAIANI